MEKKIAVTDEFYENIAFELANYAVGFVRVREDETQVDAQFIGSGTLVEIDGKYAILTADHVLETLSEEECFGLVVFSFRESEQPGLHRVDVKKEYITMVRVGRGKIESEGPDLALLFLYDSELVGTIKAKKSFCNLSKRRDEILSDPRPVNEGFWVLSGTADEWTEDAPPEKQYKRVKIFRGFLYIVEIDSEYNLDGYDYLEIKIDYSINDQVPGSFGGYSGGGLWQVLVKEGANGEPVVVDRILSGVAFYQSPLEDGIRIIKCHGRQSIYRNVIDKVRESSSKK